MSFTLDEVASIGSHARNLLRDFPQYFEVNVPGPLRPTIKLPHPLVSDLDLVNLADNSVIASSAYGYDARNGLLKITTPSAYATGVHIQGYFYEWFLPDDLTFYASYVVHDHAFERGDLDSDDVTPIERDVMAIGTVVMALMALLSEFSTQIDVSSPEGMMIPAHQRYTQVQQLYAYWAKRYEQDAANLNVGKGRISMRTLRRVSRMTNRLVPLFENREIDDPRPPMRSFPPIPPISPDQETNGDPGMSEVGVTNWTTLGGSG